MPLCPAALPVVARRVMGPPQGMLCATDTTCLQNPALGRHPNLGRHPYWQGHQHPLALAHPQPEVAVPFSVEIFLVAAAADPFFFIMEADLGVETDSQLILGFWLYAPLPP